MGNFAICSTHSLTARDYRDRWTVSLRAALSDLAAYPATEFVEFGAEGEDDLVGILLRSWCRHCGPAVKSSS